MNEEIRKYMSELGKKSAARLTPKQRKARAKKAANSRWKSLHNQHIHVSIADDKNER
jgi:hypothetical protein